MRIDFCITQLESTSKGEERCERYQCLRSYSKLRTRAAVESFKRACVFEEVSGNSDFAKVNLRAIARWIIKPPIPHARRKIWWPKLAFAPQAPPLDAKAPSLHHCQSKSSSRFLKTFQEETSILPWRS